MSYDYDPRHLPVPSSSTAMSVHVPKRPWWTQRRVAKQTSFLKTAADYTNAQGQFASSLKACADARFDAARSLSRLDDLNSYQAHWAELAWIERDIEINQARARHAQTIQQLQGYLPPSECPPPRQPAAAPTWSAQSSEAIRRTLESFPEVPETSRDAIAQVLAGLVQEKHR